MKILAVAGAWLLIGTALVPALGQSAGVPNLPTQPPYTLKVNTRVVLTDVTVTDSQGNPVTGLTASDFRILDNGKSQTLSSFEPHRQQQATLVPIAARGHFSNQYLLNPPPQVNVLLFDTTTIDIVDQMYLFQQMKQLVENLPAGSPVAVFTRAGSMTLQLATFTDDHARLMQAIANAIPRLRRPGAWMASEVDTLQQIATDLTQIPGRKNLLWFTSGSNLLLTANPMGIHMDAARRRAIYDLLESERIAIYPIDARGLVVYPNRAMILQQFQMRQDAEATGGTAFVNNNGLALAAQQILSTDGNYYTLSYTPNNLKQNNKWHRVQVKLDGKDYELSYRRGYFDDGSTGPALVLPAGTFRKVLRAGGTTTDAPDDRNQSIVFDVKILPVSAAAPPSLTDVPLKHGERRYVMEYNLSSKEVYAAKRQGDAGTDEVNTAVLVYDRNGELVSRRMLKWTLAIDERRVREFSNPRLDFAETLNLPKGQNHLYIGLWDDATGRLGTVHAEVEVDNP